MNVNFLIIIPIVLVLIAWFYILYISLIKKRNKVMEAFSSIDVQLKKRYDLLPNILTIAQKFMEHEKFLIEEVTAMRTQYQKMQDVPENVNDKIKLNNALSNKLNNVFVAFENYPQLKSDQTMITAIQTYNEVEEHISAARRFYNSAVNELNNAVDIFPSSLIASVLGIRSFEFFITEEKEKAPINASDYLK